MGGESGYIEPPVTIYEIEGSAGTAAELYRCPNPNNGKGAACLTLKNALDGKTPAEQIRVAGQCIELCGRGLQMAVESKSSEACGLQIYRKLTREPAHA